MAATVVALLDGGVKWPSMTAKAQHERLLWVNQMFAWLVAQEWVTENPTIAVLGEQTQTAASRKAQRQAVAARAETADDDDRRAFTPEELKLIFGQTHYKTGNGAHITGNGRWYPFEFWLPIIGLLAGCRIGEICQLCLDDIRQSDDGTFYFDINETTPDKSLKNANAVRQIPVSPVLVEPLQDAGLHSAPWCKLLVVLQSLLSQIKAALIHQRGHGNLDPLVPGRFL